MTAENTIDDPYESPTLEVVGTLHELTRNGALFPSDDGVHANTANPLPS